MKINGIKFKFSGEIFEIKDRGSVYIVNLIGTYTHSEVSTALIGEKYKDRKIIGVEMFAVENQTDKPIGILLE